MDWWKLRLCAHPGLVDRVEGRPLYSCVDARHPAGHCAAAGTLWEAVPAPMPTSHPGEWVKLNVQDTERMERIFAGAVNSDPVDEAVGYAFGQSLVREEGAPLVIDPGMLPRKPARQRKPRAPREAIE
jgi:hypothetical protein